jgi:hypothetical protein
MGVPSGLLLFPRAGAQPERKIERTKPEGAGKRWHEADESPPRFKIKARAEDNEASDVAEGAVDAAYVGFHGRRKGLDRDGKVEYIGFLRSWNCRAWGRKMRKIFFQLFAG